MSALKNFALPAVALLAMAGFWLWRGSTDTVAATTPATAQPSSRPSGTPVDHRSDGSAKAEPTAAAAPLLAATAKGVGSRATQRDRAKTDALRLQLRTLDRKGASARRGARDDAEVDQGASGTLDAAYIQARVREDLLPIAKECYESALEDQPKLGGTLTMKFSIVGDPSVGGVVDEADVDPASEVTHPDLLECMRESMLSLSFPPPEGGGKVDVTYPFVFASEAPAGEGE